jgi:hypothetical protein
MKLFSIDMYQLPHLWAFGGVPNWIQAYHSNKYNKRASRQSFAWKLRRHDLKKKIYIADF